MSENENYSQLWEKELNEILIKRKVKSQETRLMRINNQYDIVVEDSVSILEFLNQYNNPELIKTLDMAVFTALPDFKSLPSLNYGKAYHLWSDGYIIDLDMFRQIPDDTPSIKRYRTETGYIIQNAHYVAYAGEPTPKTNSGIYIATMWNAKEFREVMKQNNFPSSSFRINPGRKG